ncbi:MAG: DbpA RNA binding domain-containing protein [Treponema sp.]|jgi:hypothetical protein|nr:DbpA RNA binding domain-containing protein [Treponema sp.]
MSAQFDKEKTKKNIALIVEQIKNEANPELLNQYRTLFKKEVSLFHRSYTAAYLLMLYDQGRLRGQGGNFRNRSPGFAGKGERHGRAEYGRAPEEPRTERQYPLSDEDSRRLFISIGRNRRVFPREILGLINSTTDVAREDVGAIRILDNYSFVQVRDTVADAIIEALNGKSFRGRILSVNYAHSRKDGGEDGYDAEAAAGDNADSVDTEQYDDEAVAGVFLSGGSPEQDDDHPDEKSV